MQSFKYYSMVSALALSLLMMASGCNRETAMQPGSLDHPMYSTTIFDAAGQSIASGYLAFNSEWDERAQLEGEWSFSPMQERDHINNPFTGTGHMEGTRHQDTLALNLHPGWVDHNLYLQGHFHGDSLSGQWTWVGFPGIIDRGRFAATLQ